MSMLLAKTSQMRAIEEEAISAQGINLEELMERAGAAVAKEAEIMMPAAGGALIFCGKGNNGGDGFVAARLLAANGFEVEVVMLSPPEQLSGAAANAYEKIAHESKIKKIPADSGRDPKRPDLVIDAIFGFGLSGAVRGAAAKLIKAINLYDQPVLAVDIPSGIDSDTGQCGGEAVRATRTITFTAPKVGMALYPGLDYVGEIRIADIGIDKAIVARSANVCLGSRPIVRRLLPTRSPDAHKSDCGRVLVVAGSVGMTGAAALCAQAALRTGAGLVYLAVPQSANAILEIKLTEVITKPMPETPARTIRAKAIEPIMEIAPDMDAVVVGPGMSRHQSTVTLIRQMVSLVGAPLVIDADGLNALVGKVDLVKKRAGDTIMTPHPGELGRLAKVAAASVQADRLAAAERASGSWGATLVLKGARTVIAGKGCTYINPTGNAGMATAGTGDVLAGMIAGFVAQGLPAYPASVLSTYLHGRAGDLGAEDLTELALIATDLLDYLPIAFKELRTGGV